MYNNQDFRYQLDSPRVTGRRQQKTTCPQCGHKHCFVRYVDTHNNCQYVSDDVGRCDHEQSCGYHYRPSEYFRDKPWLRDHEDDWKRPLPRPVVPPKPQPLLELDMGMVLGCHSPMSTFWQWMQSRVAHHLGVTSADVQRVFDQYLIGTTRESDVIFWQIDHLQRVLTGHIMCYGPDGHRLGRQSWVHFRLQQQGQLPLSYQPPKCLFGEHLLAIRPTAPVAIVESEKTALVMALKMPEFLWLATAGCGGLTKEKMAPLTGRQGQTTTGPSSLTSRKVLVFPDSGCYEKWQQQLAQVKGLNYSISRHLEAYPPNTDLADVVLATP